jgi:hypothetical protein
MPGDHAPCSLIQIDLRVLRIVRFHELRPAAAVCDGDPDNTGRIPPGEQNTEFKPHPSGGGDRQFADANQDLPHSLI